MSNLNVHTGVLSVTGHEHRGLDSLPPVREIGNVVPQDVGDLGSPQYLEVPFDFARWRVLEAIPKHWRQEGELPMEFRLYGDHLCIFKRPNVPSEVRRYFTEQTAMPAQTDFDALDEILSDASNRSYLKLWLKYNKQTLSLAHLANVPESNLGRQHLAHALLDQLDDQPIGEEIANALQDNLRAQAAWFECLGESDVAEFSFACAKATPVAPMSQNPLMNKLMIAILESLTGGTSAK
jgi:hypothetical protein